MTAEIVTLPRGEAEAPDRDTVYREFVARAAALPTGSIAGTDALMSEIVASELPTEAFKSLATAAAKASGLDRDTLHRKMVKARAVSEGTAAT